MNTGSNSAVCSDDRLAGWSIPRLENLGQGPGSVRMEPPRKRAYVLAHGKTLVDQEQCPARDGLNGVFDVTRVEKDRQISCTALRDRNEPRDRSSGAIPKGPAMTYRELSNRPGAKGDADHFFCAGAVGGAAAGAE